MGGSADPQPGMWKCSRVWAMEAPHDKQPSVQGQVESPTGRQPQLSGNHQLADFALFPAGLVNERFAHAKTGAELIVRTNRYRSWSNRALPELCLQNAIRFYTNRQNTVTSSSKCSTRNVMFQTWFCFFKYCVWKPGAEQSATLLRWTYALPTDHHRRAISWK